MHINQHELNKHDIAGLRRRHKAAALRLTTNINRKGRE